MNCWEYKKCGREEGGANVESLGICPAATESRTHHLNSGKNGGRSCWAIVGTLCGGKVQGTAAQKISNCMSCDFFKLVHEEQSNLGTYVPTKEILKCLAK